MSYRYYDSIGMNVLVSTPKAFLEKEICGIVIPLGLNRVYKEVHDYLEHTSHNIYIAKHCDDQNVLTHIGPSFSHVNRFGFFITDNEILSTSPIWSIEIGKGWFKRVKLNSVKDLDVLMEKIRLKCC